MSALDENALAKVAQVDTVDLNTETFNNLLVVPTGKKFIPHSVMVHKLSGDAASAVVTLGQSGAMTDFLGSQTLSNLSAAGKAGILQPIPNATPVAVVEYTEGEIFGVDIATAAGGAVTATFSVFGLFMDA